MEAGMFSYWSCVVITAVSALVSLGFAIASVVTATAGNALGSRYALSRSIALTVASVIALFAGSAGFVIAVAIAMTLIQAADAIIGGLAHDRPKTVGPAILAALTLAALLWLLVQML
jgi:hypothetical protein